jgi:hypothetical protein
MLAFAVSMSACNGPNSSERVDDTLTIELRWIRGYAGEQRSDVETGILWTLSFLGASLPREEASLLRWRDNTLELRLDRAGIDDELVSNWRQLLAVLKSSEEYRSVGAIDIGRFVALTLCSSNHYFALTGARSSYADLRAAYEFETSMTAIVESSVATGQRLLEAAGGSSSGEMAFVAHEGAGSLAEGNFRVLEHEAVDVMPNGQLRFALYDLGGMLKPVADDRLTTAGKPSKCLWCHETEFSPPFRGRTSVEGYRSLAEFERQIAEFNSALGQARQGLDSEIDFERKQDHVFAELLYLSFYEPSAQRLAQEWNIEADDVSALLESLSTHAQSEHEFLGNRLYERHLVDQYAPYATIAVPTDPREASIYEPDLLR